MIFDKFLSDAKSYKVKLYLKIHTIKFAEWILLKIIADAWLKAMKNFPGKFD